MPPAIRARRPALLAAVALVCVLAALLDRPAAAQPRDAARVGAWVAAHEPAIVGELVEFLRLPNVASNLDDIRINAEALVRMMQRRGITTRLLETGGAPMVYGELLAPGATTTILFYCHYDGQPVEAAHWTGHHPFEPLLRDGALATGARPLPLEGHVRFDPDWRLYARSASDDKSPIVALMNALDALRAIGAPPTVNVKFLFEGDEEAGSPHMAETIRRHRELLAADLVIMADGPEHPSGRPTITFGLRGITSVRIVAYGAGRPLHSGHFGNWAPNPALELARLLASMKDGDGRVLVAGFYDDVRPLTEEERAAIAAVPAERPEDYGFAVPEGGPGARRLERIALPSLNVRGLAAAGVGEAVTTIVPDSAVAEIDLRLVPDIEPGRQVERVVAHVRQQGWHVVTGDTPPDRATRAAQPRVAWVRWRDSGYPATRTRFDHPVAQRVVRALREWGGDEPVIMPIMGGSAPGVWFPAIGGTDLVILPIVNEDNNQHAADENVRLGNVFRGIVLFAGVMRM
jgi:acetylornithine deacetylase/succinyl-diaminopimelate desuccinylase-like protein